MSCVITAKFTEVIFRLVHKISLGTTVSGRKWQFDVSDFHAEGNFPVIRKQFMFHGVILDVHTPYRVHSSLPSDHVLNSKYSFKNAKGTLLLCLILEKDLNVYISRNHLFINTEDGYHDNIAK